MQAVGKVASAAVVGLMVHRLSPRTCFLVVAALPFLVALSSLAMREERTPCCGGRRREPACPCQGPMPLALCRFITQREFSSMACDTGPVLRRRISVLDRCAQRTDMHAEEFSMSIPECLAGKGGAECGSILQEKLALLGRTCTNKYLLLPALFFFLWQVSTMFQRWHA